jgi:hypothetical protein
MRHLFKSGKGDASGGMDIDKRGGIHQIELGHHQTTTMHED